jgi:hypothetical protein
MLKKYQGFWKKKKKLEEEDFGGLFFFIISNPSLKNSKIVLEESFGRFVAKLMSRTPSRSMPF